MSFLNQLKSQASALQDQKSTVNQNLDGNTAQTEAACKVVWHYVADLCRQLNVIAPPGPRFSLDGKTPWPAMKLMDFRADFRKKKLRDKEVHDYIGMGWQITPQIGVPVGGVVSVNFPPDLERVQSRLSMGMVKHERKEVRHPEKTHCRRSVLNTSPRPAAASPSPPIMTMRPWHFALSMPMALRLSTLLGPLARCRPTCWTKWQS